MAARQARIEVFGARTGNCFRAAIALEEAGLAYEPRVVDLAHKEQRGPAFLALNPQGKVPVLVEYEENRPAFVLSQSNAILMHVAERSRGRLLPENDPVARARCYERFLFFVTDVIAPSHAAFALRRAGKDGDEAAFLDRSSVGALASSDHMLAVQPFIDGDRFTLADISAYTIALAYQESIDWRTVPHLERWFERVGARPSVQRGLAAFNDPPERKSA